MQQLSAPAEEFLSWLAVERGRAENTLRAYRRDLGSFENFLQKRHRKIAQAKESDVESYIHTLESDNAAPATVVRKLTAVRTFFRFAIDESLIDHDPTEAVARPKLPSHLPKALSEDEIKSLLSAVTGNDATALRDRAMLELLYGTGIRISELVDISLLDLSLDDQTMRVFGKGSKERIVPVGKYAREALRNWLSKSGREVFIPHQWAHRGDAEALFLNARGRRISRSGVWRILRHYAERAGLADRVTPHVLRHSCATHMLEHGADIRVVQELLGHASIATTQIYTRVTPEKLRSVYEEAHPRARIR